MLWSTLPFSPRSPPFPPISQAEYLQYDLDGNDINGAKQSAGEVIGKFIVTDDAPSADALQPFQDAFGLQVGGQAGRRGRRPG